jgi:hypothetical protein
MRVLLTLWGESFRYGPQASRSRGISNSKELQTFASQSHLDFVSMLENKYNCNVDIFLNTYKLNNDYDNYLVNFYKKYIVKEVFYDSLFPGEIQFLNNMYDIVCNVMNNYELLIFIRIDLYLKSYFINEAFYINNNKIMFAHIDSNLASVPSHYGICQQIMTFPKKLYFTISNKIIYDSTHGIWVKLNNFGVKDIGLFINTLHICSTDLGWNPLYIQIGRNINTTYELGGVCQSSIDHYYDDKSRVLIKDATRTIERWKNYIVDDKNFYFDLNSITE